MHCCLVLPTSENKHSSLNILGFKGLLGIKVTVQHQSITTINFSTKRYEQKKNKNSEHPVVQLSGQRPMRHYSEKQDDPIKNRMSDHPKF